MWPFGANDDHRSRFVGDRQRAVPGAAIQHERGAIDAADHVDAARPLVMMSNGTLWRIVGRDAVPRQFNTPYFPNAQGVQILPAPWTMSSTPPR
jgi:hypothetical protein